MRALSYAEATRALTFERRLKELEELIQKADKDEIALLVQEQFQILSWLKENKLRAMRRTCPHCGANIDGP